MNSPTVARPAAAPPRRGPDRASDTANHLSDQDLAALLDDRAQHPHLDGCETCRARHAALASLTRAFRADTAPDPAAVHLIMSRIQRPRRRWIFGVAIAAVAVAIALIVTLRPTPPEATFASRGGPPTHALVTPFIHEPASAPRVPLEDGAVVGRDVALSFRAFAPKAPTYLLIAACDPQGELHWAVPVWNDAAQNPQGLLLSPDVPFIDLPVGLQPESAGRFTVLIATSATPLGVQNVERAMSGCDPRSLAPLGLDVTTTTLVIR